MTTARARSRKRACISIMTSEAELHVADAGEIAGEEGDGGDENEDGLDDHDEIPYG